MDEFESLSHSKWECKYHVVFIPKFRRKVLYGELRRHLGEVFRKYAEQRESRVEEGHLMPDHVHMMLSIPPKYAVSQVVGYIKGKSAIHLARVYGERHRLLGPRIFRFDDRARRERHPRLHQEPRERGPAPGSNEPLALKPPSGGPMKRGRVGVPSQPL
jgi:putative transposase